MGANHIQNFLDVLEQYPETDLVITGRRKFFEGEQIEEKVFKPKMRLMPGEEAIRISIDAKDQTFSVNAWGKLYRRNLFPCLEFPEGKLYEDNYVYYKAICNAEKIVYEDANDYYYLIDRADSITNTNSLKSLDELRAFDEMLLYVKDRLPDAYDPVFATFAGKHVAGYEIARSLNEKVIANDLYRRMLSIRSDVLKKSCVPASTRIAFFTTFLGRPMFNLALRLNRVKLLYEKARKEKEALN